MNLLCFDTTSRDASIAVLRDEEIMLEYNFSSQDNLSAVMIPSLEFLLRSLGMNISQIDLFGVAVGPGLFTGIRIGLATLKGMNFAAPKPMVAVNTLEALAFKLADSKKSIVTLIDARKGEVYLGCYQFVKGEMNILVQPCLLPVSALASLLNPIADKVFVGSGAEYHGDFLKSTFPESRILYRSNFLASEIGKIALQRFRNREYTTDLQKLLPFYIRRPDAESNLARATGAID
ncbi:MAG TPA: tRNA (adenosine(37)-N6)-threonylcarbamoyltransferase complex dimerization subunit type 1 TsaB [Patescibacteria group bacterium]|nr:tRNA (adenosine(37)-N6)-threonylcarbamoyltransferase complex dimerization subunit type 1 TsaB [Patescibacteria group bacterium]